ncbi:MAG: hypothetical protein QOF66_7727 [Mycobacterium sp.]|nr:hypothetical protein [Mycobacterium sp.]
MFRHGSSRRSARICTVFAISEKHVVAGARIIRVKNARGKQRSARRRLVQPGQTIRRTSHKVNGDVGVSVANAELDQLLTERGWIESCRADGRTMYDWPPSAPDIYHEITYLITDLRGEPGAGPPYRVSVVNGDRMMYEVESALIAHLDTIEAARCAECMPCPHEAAG